MEPPLSRWITAAEFGRDRVFENCCYLLDGQVFEDMRNAERVHEISKAGLQAALILAFDRAVFAETAYELNAYTVLIPDISIQLPARPSGPGFFSRLARSRRRNHFAGQLEAGNRQESARLLDSRRPGRVGA